ncbi:MAG TPA: carbamoyltransferase HypF [Anaerolineaceae bacterium]|nr:carbamoyltransferase HypF [Anaerolineaceae bacterium]
MRIWIRGIVQGVGFRPFVYQLATRHKLTGWVRNTSSGVEIEINGPEKAVQSFLSQISLEKPPLARIDQIDSTPCEPDGYAGFEIRPSLPEAGQFIPVSPDISICPDCQRELFDPSDRRYRYPFINCTNCGPRFTIVKDIPYDRPQTTMAGFSLCPTCRSEYDNPLDRRFHAQPVACPDCGPHLSFVAGGKTLSDREDALQVARQWLKEGKIIAIKGLGGYHLACDPTNTAAVHILRQRKKRSDKPFALMAFNLETLERHCQINAAERALLGSHERPVVILEKKVASPVAPEVAPNQSTLGCMLAYTPLHLLLLEPDSNGLDLLVMTSGNLSEEPIAYQDDEAFERLDPIADGFLTHNRPIHIRVDDSVGRVVDQQPYLIRRSRGYAPDPVRLPHPVRPILAAGGELKNVFCLTRGQYAFLSHHIGDMENYETLRSFEEGIVHFERLFRIKPEIIACDLHPDYLASRYARARAVAEGLPLIEVQHHHAHLASCLADNGWDSDESAIGLSFDGTGLGPDGAIWGGEVLLGNYSQYQRLYHLSYVPLPGGDSATRKPARIALAHLWQAGLDWDTNLPPVADQCENDRTLLHSMLNARINTPLTSSMGRFFDAASALIGVRQEATYEGQAAIELEALADPIETGYYEFNIQADEFNPFPVWQGLLKDLNTGLPQPILSARFHNSLVELNLEICRRIQRATGVNTVALGGGVWQNRYLLEHTIRRLDRNGFHVLVHRQVPTNDGGLALGQALIAEKMAVKN